MASEIKVDTISEKTSAGGVTIDGLLIKDGGISGDVSLIGTTPTFTIGDAGAEDAALVVDGNAQDYYIALDDSADDLLIGLGSTVGTTPAIAIDENLKVNIPVTTASTSASTGSLTTGGGAGIGADLYVGDDTYLITDSAVLGFGADKDTTLTHTDGTGLTLNSTNKLTFGDAASFIQQSSDGVLRIDGEATVDINASAAITLAAANVPVTVGGIPFYYGDTGSIYTHNVSGTDDTAQWNTAYGLTALDAITTGDSNTAVGFSAGGAVTTGASNVAIGYQALDNADAESHNVAIGKDTMGGPVNGGEYNVGIGGNAFAALTSGDNNVSIGYGSGAALTTGADHILLGYNAGNDLTTANNNVLIGSAAGAAATSMYHSVGIGYQALGSGTVTGDNKVAIGYQAGYSTTSGHSDIAIGFEAMKLNTTGVRNVAVGYSALDVPDTENDNLAIGYDAMGGAVAGGEFNVAIGNYAGDALTSADNCVAVGFNALTDLTTGAKNTACGYEALANVVGGANNVGLGHFAGGTITSGDNNICIGIDSGISGSPGGALGTGDNQLCLGDENIANAHVQVDWTVASDKRDKTDVSSIDIGLNFINKLEPVTYYWDKRSKYDDSNPTGEHKEDKLDIGFLAQDVEVLENEYGYKIEDKTNLTTHLSEDGEQYGIQYSKFVPILVKAVQELSAQVTTLKDEINNLKGG